MKKLPQILILAAVILTLSACASAAAAPPEPLEITIELSEYAFSMDALEFQVGQEVTIHLVNVGQLEHEFMIGREVGMTDNRPNGYVEDFFESAGVEPMVMMEEDHDEGEDHDDEMGEEEHDEDGHMHEGFMVTVPVGHDTYTITFTVTEDMVGEWEIGCFLLDGVHYDAGMVGTLVVTE